MKIISLEAENFKRLRAIRIEPDGSAVIIGGKNRAGKTSALDAIRAALGGKKHCPEEPIRRGAKKAEIVLNSEELTVTRTFSKKGTALEVKAKDGSAFASPQTMLDQLIGSLSFDPLEFSRMKPAEQADVVRRLIGLDFDELEQERSEIYSDRTDIGRDLKRARALLDTIEIVEAPEAEISVSDAVNELTRRLDVNHANDVFRDDLEILRREDVKISEEIKEGNEQLAAEIAARKATIKELEECQAANRDRGSKLAAKVAKLKDEDVAEAQAVIDGAEEINRKVRLVAERKQAETEASELAATYDKRRREIEALDERKAEAIQSAEYPIEGLRVTDDGVELNDLPFEQASSAEQLRCSVAMGFALNPKLKVLLVKDGSLLDAENLELVAKAAADADAQVWIERVGDGEECTVVIEDGSIVKGETDG